MSRVTTVLKHLHAAMVVVHKIFLSKMSTQPTFILGPTTPVVVQEEYSGWMFLWIFLIIIFIFIIIGIVVFLGRRTPGTRCNTSSDCQPGFVCINGICSPVNVV